MRGALPREAQRDLFVFLLKTSRFTPKSGSKGSNRVKPGALRDRASFGRMARVTRRAALCTVPPFVSACLPSSAEGVQSTLYRVHFRFFLSPVFSRVTPVYSGFSSQAHHGASPRPSVTAKTRGPIEGGLSRVKSNGEIDYLINCVFFFFLTPEL